MLDARDAAVSVQKNGEAAAIREAIRESRARTAEVLHAARDVLVAVGFAVVVDTFSTSIAGDALPLSELRFQDQSP